MSNAEIILRTAINHRAIVVSNKKIRRAARMVNRKLADKKIDCALARITGAIKRWEKKAAK